MNKFAFQKFLRTRNIKVCRNQQIKIVLFLLVVQVLGGEIAFQVDSTGSINWNQIPQDSADTFYSWKIDLDSGNAQLVGQKRSILAHQDGGYINGNVPDFISKSTRKLAQITRSQNIVLDEAIIGSDDRFIVQETTKFPFSAVGMLQFQIGDSGTQGKCTGTMISEQSFLTSAHCIWDYRYQAFNKNFIFYPGRDGNKKAYGEVELLGVSIPNAWVQQGLQEHDYAVVMLNSSIGNETGYFGFGYDCGYANNLSYERYGLIGYPFDKFGEQWMGVCNVQAYDPCQGDGVEPIVIQHNCDTLGGQSGAVVWKIIEQQIYIRAIHQGFSYDQVGFNSAVAITPPVFDFILRNIKDE